MLIKICATQRRQIAVRWLREKRPDRDIKLVIDALIKDRFQATMEGVDILRYVLKVCAEEYGVTKEYLLKELGAKK